MGIFRFKKFDVCDDCSAMKVGTDGVLLGAAAEVSMNVKSVLDIGTGCGLIALMLAQRLADISSSYHIQGIEIDSEASAEAEENFRHSPWKNHLESVNMSLDAFGKAFPESGFDLIISNPPYYDNSLEAPQARRNVARHVSAAREGFHGEPLSYREIFEFSRAHLNGDGRVWLVLPADQEGAMLRYGKMLGLYPCRMLRVRSVKRKPPVRIIVGMAFGKNAAEEDELVLLDEKGKRTSEHASLTNDFYL